MSMEKLGGYAFLAGVVIAILAALLPMMGMTGMEGMIVLVLAVLGLLVGLLNVNDKETVAFLVAAIALSTGGTALAAFSALPMVGIFSTIFAYIAVFVAPAAFIVALKAIYALGKD